MYLNKKFVFCLNIFLFFGLLVALFSAQAQQGSTDTQEIPIPDKCWPDIASKDGDGNGDGISDWLLHTQTDQEGNKVELWCIDQDESDHGDEYYAVVYVDKETGKRKFVGKCPFEGGDNEGSKTHKDGVIDSISWESDDKGNKDDDGDGKEDDAVYEYNPKTNKLVEKHSEDGKIIEEKEKEPKEDDFDFGDLHPRDPTNPDFWALTINPPSSALVQMYPKEWTHALVRITTLSQEDGAVLGKVEINIRDAENRQVETVRSSSEGTVVVMLPVGSYVLEAKGVTKTLEVESPTSISLSVPGGGNTTIVFVSLAVLATAVAVMLLVKFRKKI